MVPGFNHNIKHKGQIFHIQTEDSGTQNPHIITHLFVGGNILATKKTSYADIVQAENLPEIVRELMQEQHKAMLRNLINGVYDELAGGPGEPPPVSAPPKGVPPPLSRPVPLAPQESAAPAPAGTVPKPVPLPPPKPIPLPPPGVASRPPSGTAALPPSGVASRPPSGTVPKPIPLPPPPASSRPPAAAAAPLEPGKFPKPVPEPPVSAPPAAARPAARADTTAPVSSRRPPSTTKIMIPSQMEAERVATSDPIPTSQPRVVLRPKAQASQPPAPAAQPPTATAPPSPSGTAPLPPPASSLPPPGVASLPPAGPAALPPPASSLPPEVVAARALAEKPKPKDVSGPTIFGENLISEKSLDEVILGYLAGNEDEGK
jgi:hypothetical protein